MSHRILVVGVGSIGERHLRCFQKTGRVDAGLCELNDSLRQTVAERYSVKAAYKSLDEALAGGWEAAVICTPAHLHIAQARQAVKAGLHLLIEKPLSTSLDGVADLIGEARAAHRKTAVAYVQRFNPTVVALRQVLQSGRFGEPVQLYFTSGQHFPTFRPAYRTIYYTKHATGGGAIQDALTHGINAAEWLVGPVQRLVADAAHQVLEGVDVEDTVHLIARQGSGVLSTFSLNQHQAPNELTITVVCRRGTVRAALHERKISTMSEPNAPWEEQVLPPMERDDIFVLQANGFLDYLDDKAPARATLEDGLQTLKVNLAALRSVQQGNWQTI
jgi:predicted dehydrogenase